MGVDTDFERHRRFLTRLAYRLLGSVSDAEDIAQETFVRWNAAGCPVLRTPRAWFTRTCTRLALDRLKSAQRQREQYVGEWLPEPLLADEREDRSELDDTLSMALLMTVQRLRPTERAAFLLHDVFAYEFTEVAEILDLEPAHCRQLAARARKRLHERRPQPRADEATVRRLSAAFFSAIESGDLQGLHAVLAEDVALHTDGGGKVSATRRPITGVTAVARFFHRIFRATADDAEVREAWFNGAPGALVHERGQLVSAFQFHVENARIAGIYVQRNPDKLQAFGA